MEKKKLKTYLSEHKREIVFGAACVLVGVKIGKGRIKKNELNVYTVAESYCLDSPIMFEGWKKYFEMYNVTTIKEFAAIYNQYKNLIN